MRWTKPTLLFLIVFLFLTIQVAVATTWHFPKARNIPRDSKWHFGDYWIETIDSSVKITVYFENNWFNYTCTTGTQKIYTGTKPVNVYFDDVDQLEGPEWSYSSGVTSIDPSGTDVALLYGVNPSQLTAHVVNAQNLLAYGENFNIEIEDASLQFQGTYDIDFECVTGAWNATNGTLSVWLERGSISFIPVDNCTLDIGTIADREFQVECSGATLTKSEGNYTATISSGPRVTISWRFLPWSLIDNYFMFGVGLTGIIMLIAGPTWFARTFIKHGLDTETIEHLGYAMLLLVMGFGFVVVWLWP